MQQTLLISIPAFNEAKTILSVLEKIPHSYIDIGKYEVLLIDDGSTDDTVNKVRKKFPEVKIVSHSINKGVGSAFHTGVGYALQKGFDIMATIDADGQFNPQDIPKLIKPIINKECDLVTASRFMNKKFIPNMPLAKLYGNRAVSFLISLLTGQKFYDVSCGFRAYNKEALLRLNLFGTFTYVQEVFLDLCFKGLKIKEVPVAVLYFDDRVSRIATNLFSYALKISMIIFSSLRDYKPFRFFGFIGSLIFILGGGVDLLVFNHFLVTGELTPYKAFGIIGLTLNLFGFGIISLGFVADMLTRIRLNQEKLLYFQKLERYYPLTIEKR